MKNFAKIFAFMLVLALAFTMFAACNKKDDTKKSDDTEAEKVEEQIKGEEQTWGNITVFVPEGYKLNTKNLFGEEDPDEVSLTSESDEYFDYFKVTANMDENNVTSSLDTTRDINEGCTDIEFTAGGKTWTGVTYNSSGYDVVSAYAPFGDSYVLVMTASHTSDDPTFLAVIESLQITAAE